MSEEKQVKGIIQAISKKEKNFSIKIGDLWLSGWNNKFPELNTMNKGDLAEVSYIQNETGERTFNNIVEGKLKITQGTPSEQKSEFKPYSNVLTPEEKKEKRKDILKSVSIKAGVETINNMTLNTGEEGEAVAKKVIEIAEIYYTWLKGEK